MKYFLLFTLFFDVKKCYHKVPAPTLLTATSQHWSGGAAGSGHGTNYNFYFKNSTAWGYVFDSVWLNDRRLVVTTSPTVKGDTLLLSAERFFKGELQFHQQQTIDSTEEQTVLFPVMNYDGAAIIGYWFNGVRGYIAVKDFVYLPALNYP